VKTVLKVLVAVLVAWGLVKVGRHVDFGNLAASLPGGSEHRVTVISVSCIAGAMPRADVEIRNSGSTTLKNPKGLVRFGDASQEGFFSPGSVPPDSNATMTVYASWGQGSGCSLFSVEDSEGHKAKLMNRTRPINPRDRMTIVP
jgi:hypothetical protein